MNDMSTPEVKEHWDHIYQAKPSQEVSWFQEKPETSLRLIAGVGLNKDTRIIDVGAGDSTLVDYLLALGFKNITVLDVSPVALERAKKRVGKKDTVSWVAADVLRFETDAQFGLWHDRAVLHFLTKKEEQSKYAATVERLLTPGGFLIIAAFSPYGPTKCSGLDVQQYSEDSLKRLFRNLEHLQSFEEEHITPRGTKQSFLYGVFRKRSNHE